ncbi:MAG: hypothetical protein ACR2OW_01570 [Methyloligellaceae bacterium]
MANSGNASKDTGRKERLAAALRENLRKRKKTPENRQVSKTGAAVPGADDAERNRKT